MTPEQTAALKPFLDFAQLPSFDNLPDDYRITPGSPMAAPQLTVGQFKALRAAFLLPQRGDVRDPTFNAHGVQVLIDGEPANSVIAYDIPKGTVTVATTDADGLVIFDEFGNTVIETFDVPGRITVKRI